jgi:hypothetical protein
VDDRPDREPLARRAFRHPGTGHEAVLVVDRRGTSGGPRELLWRVWLEDAPGRPPEVAALRFLSVHETRDQTKRVFAERQQALCATGYQRVE